MKILMKFLLITMMLWGQKSIAMEGEGYETEFSEETLSNENAYKDYTQERTEKMGELTDAKEQLAADDPKRDELETKIGEIGSTLTDVKISKNNYQEAAKAGEDTSSIVKEAEKQDTKINELTEAAEKIVREEAELGVVEEEPAPVPIEGEVVPADQPPPTPEQEKTTFTQKAVSFFKSVKSVFSKIKNAFTRVLAPETVKVEPADYDTMLKDPVIAVDPVLSEALKEEQQINQIGQMLTQQPLTDLQIASITQTEALPTPTTNTQTLADETNRLIGDLPSDKPGDDPITLELKSENFVKNNNGRQAAFDVFYSVDVNSDISDPDVRKLLDGEYSEVKNPLDTHIASGLAQLQNVTGIVQADLNLRIADWQTQRQVLQEAYDILTDPDKLATEKQLYDASYALKVSTTGFTKTTAGRNAFNNAKAIAAAVKS